MPLEISAGPTIGRESELEQLEAALEALAGGASACVALEGEPGIGKTRLLSELRRRAEQRGCLVLAGSAAEFERDVPFSVWADALDAYVASQELGLRERWDAELVEELAEILPSLRRSGATVRASVADERYRAHRAVGRLLALLASSRPLVLVTGRGRRGQAREGRVLPRRPEASRRAGAPERRGSVNRTGTGSCGRGHCQLRECARP